MFRKWASKPPGGPIATDSGPKKGPIPRCGRPKRPVLAAYPCSPPTMLTSGSGHDQFDPVQRRRERKGSNQRRSCSRRHASERLRLAMGNPWQKRTTNCVSSSTASGGLSRYVSQRVFALVLCARRVSSKCWLSRCQIRGTAAY